MNRVFILCNKDDEDMYEQLTFFNDTKVKEIDSSSKISFTISRWPDDFKLDLSIKETELILSDLRPEVQLLHELLKKTTHICSRFRIEDEIRSATEIIKLLQEITLNKHKNDYKMKYRHALCIIDMYRRKDKPFSIIEKSISYNHAKRLKKCKQKQSKLEESIGEDGLTALATKKKED